MGNISHHVWRWERTFELTQLILRVLTRIGIKQGAQYKVNGTIFIINR